MVQLKDTLLTPEKFTLREIHDRNTSSRTHTDMLSRFLGVHDQCPDKLSVRDITAAVFINMLVLYFTYCSDPFVSFSLLPPSFSGL